MGTGVGAGTQEMQLFPCEQRCQWQRDSDNWAVCGEMQQPAFECMRSGYSIGRPLYEDVGWRGAGGAPNGWGAQYAGVHCREAAGVHCREAGGPQYGSFFGL